MQMAVVSTLHATILDKFARHFPEGRRRILLLLVICIAQFILALSLCTSVSHLMRYQTVYQHDHTATRC